MCRSFHDRKYCNLKVPYQYHDNARDISWQGKSHWGRWDNRKDYSRLQGERFRCVHYRGSGLWKNGIPLSGNHKFRSCQKQSPREKYPVKTEGEERSSRSGPDEGRRSPRQTCLRLGNLIFFYRHLGMSLFKIIIQESDMPDDPKAVWFVIAVLFHFVIHQNHIFAHTPQFSHCHTLLYLVTSFSCLAFALIIARSKDKTV